MVDQLSPSQIPQSVVPATLLLRLEDGLTEVAKQLRQRSRELRASSELLKLRNAEIMARASEVSLRVMDYDTY